MSVFLTPRGTPVLRRDVLPATSRATACRSFRQVLEGVARGVAPGPPERRAGGQPGRRGAAAGARRRRPMPRPDCRTPPTLDTRRRASSSAASMPGTAAGAARRSSPQPMTIEFLLRASRRDGRRAAAGHRAPDPRRDAGRRHPRSARRRLPPLQHRRPTGSSRISSRCSTTTGSSRVSTSMHGSSTAIPRIARLAEGVLDYLLRELATADGGFAASQDADTEGEEGGTFVWTAAESALRSPTTSPTTSRHSSPPRTASPTPGTGKGTTILSRLRTTRHRGAVRTAARGGRATPGCGEGRAPRSPCHAAPTRSRRQGARGLERPGDRALADAVRPLAVTGIRRPRRADRYREAAATRCRADPRRAAHRRRSAPPLVEGRAGDCDRRPRGPRPPRRRPARAL